LLFTSILFFIPCTQVKTKSSYGWWPILLTELRKRNWSFKDLNWSHRVKATLGQLPSLASLEPLVSILVSKNQIRKGSDFGSGSGIKTRTSSKTWTQFQNQNQKFWKCFFLGKWGANQKLTASFVPGYLEPDQNQLWFPDLELEPKLELNFFSTTRPKLDSRIPFSVESEKF